MPLFRVSLGLLLFRLLVLLSQGVPLVSLSWPKPFGGRDQWFARFLCGSASFFPSFVRQGFFSVSWTFFPLGQCVECWALPSFFPIVFLFALPSLGLTDEKDFFFRLPAPSLSFRSSGGGLSQIWSSLPFFFLEFSSLFLHFHCCWLMANAKVVRGGLLFFEPPEGFSLFFEQRPFSSLRVEWRILFHFFLCFFLWEVFHLFY